MFNLLFSSSEAGETIIEWIEYAATAIEILAVVIIVVPIFYNLVRYLIRRARGEEPGDPYRDLKGSLGRSMLLGLEILVAADIVRTVALETTLESVAVLGLLVLIRTFLSWSLEVEVSGHWPWQSGPEGD